MGSRNVRTLVVGIDAGCRTVFDRVDGEIPVLESLLSTGVSGPLRSQIPPWTASAWPSIYTGMNPGKHGVFDFLRFDGYDHAVVDATDVRERPIWQVLDRHGVSSVVVNVPVTHPVEPFDGALVPGYMAPESPTCHPRGLLAEIRSAVGDYRIYPESRGDGSGYVDAVASRGAAFRYLLDRFDPSFGFVQFQATDTVFHDRPDDWETIRRIYRQVDEELEAILAAADPETVLVVSDHGMGPLSGVEFRINDFLAERGTVTTTRAGTGMPTWSTARDRRLRAGESAGDGAADRSLGARFGSVAAGLGLTSQRVGRALDTVGLADTVARVLPATLVHAGTEQVDFANSVAYARSRTECGVRINLAGREPDGVVPPRNYEAVRSELVAALRAVETPDGEPVFETVAPREQFFDGPEADRAVDVVTVPNGFEQFLSAELRGQQFGAPSEPWNHKREGILAARGAAVDTGRSLGAPSLLDVAPTVLATLGVPADTRMDGRCLPFVGAAGREVYPRPDRDDRRSGADPGVDERLRDLGYLEDV